MKVLVFGGTHGNEMTGATTVLKYEKHFKKKYPNLDLHFILANPLAYSLNQRFKDEDLNRAFQYLNENRPSSYEHQRAQEIKSLVQDSPTFVIDLHTTTSHMGSTLILTHYNDLNLALASKLIEEISDCRVIGSPDPERKYLVSQSDYGMMIEVGPVPQGLLQGVALEKTLGLLDALLRSISKKTFAPTGMLPIYEEVEDVHYPLDAEGERTAYIHADFQGKDFLPIKGNYLPFRTFEGKDISLFSETELYPIFINEAAYYSNDLAFTLCRKFSKSFDAQHY